MKRKEIDITGGPSKYIRNQDTSLEVLNQDVWTIIVSFYYIDLVKTSMTSKCINQMITNPNVVKHTIAKLKLSAIHQEKDAPEDKIPEVIKDCDLHLIYEADTKNPTGSGKCYWSILKGFGSFLSATQTIKTLELIGFDRLSSKIVMLNALEQTKAIQTLDMTSVGLRGFDIRLLSELLHENHNIINVNLENQSSLTYRYTLDLIKDNPQLKCVSFGTSQYSSRNAHVVFDMFKNKWCNIRIQSFEPHGSVMFACTKGNDKLLKFTWTDDYHHAWVKKAIKNKEANIMFTDEIGNVVCTPDYEEVPIWKFDWK